jgi:hypothetical protein
VIPEDDQSREEKGWAAVDQVQSNNQMRRWSSVVVLHSTVTTDKNSILSVPKEL